jgi:hypothetical protein
MVSHVERNAGIIIVPAPAANPWHSTRTVWHEGGAALWTDHRTHAEGIASRRVFPSGGSIVRDTAKPPRDEPDAFDGQVRVSASPRGANPSETQRTPAFDRSGNGRRRLRARVLGPFDAMRDGDPAFRLSRSQNEAERSRLLEMRMRDSEFASDARVGEMR